MRNTVAPETHSPTAPNGRTMIARAAMTHCASDGAPKIVERCTYPLTGARVVSRIFTDLAIIDVRNGALEVVQLAFDGVVRPVVDADPVAPCLRRSRERQR